MRDPRLAQERSRFVEDLLSYMTLEEKLGQLDLFHNPDDPALEKAVAAGRIGGVMGAVLPARLQELATGRSRLGIPLLLVSDNVDLGLSPWALAASWDESLAQALGAMAAREAIGGGFNAVLAPRTSDVSAGAGALIHLAACEPLLTARLAAAFSRGAAGAEQGGRSEVLAIAQWSAGDPNQGLAWALGLAQAEEAAAIDCPMIGGEMAQRAGFDGMLVSECRRILALVSSQFRQSSARSALEAAERVIAQGSIGEHEIDSSVRGVLAAKHALGLFRNPARTIAPPASGGGLTRDGEKLRGTFVLLRNEAGLLPLSPVSDRVLVVGATDGAGGSCAEALGRAGIGHSLAPGLALRREGESWETPTAGDHFALSLTCDAAQRADFALVVLEDRHFTTPPGEETWRQPTPAALAMLRGLARAGARMAAIIVTAEPVDLAEADQHFAAVLQCWRPTPGFVEALGDVLSGRFSPQGRMPASAGRYLAGHGLGFGESVVSGYRLTAGSHQLEASVRARNSGSFAARETVQAYVRQADGGLRLAGFAHAMLAPGEEKEMVIPLGLEALGWPGPSGRLELAPGRYEVMVGKSSGRLLSASIDVTPALARAIIGRERGFLRLAAG